MSLLARKAHIFVFLISPIYIMKVIKNHLNVIPHPAKLLSLMLRDALGIANTNIVMVKFSILLFFLCCVYCIISADSCFLNMTLSNQYLVRGRQLTNHNFINNIWGTKPIRFDPKEPANPAGKESVKSLWQTFIPGLHLTTPILQLQTNHS